MFADVGNRPADALKAAGRSTNGASGQRDQSGGSARSARVLWSPDDQGRAGGREPVEIGHVLDCPTVGRQPRVMGDEFGRETIVDRQRIDAQAGKIRRKTSLDNPWP